MIPAGVGPERLEAIIKEAGRIVLSYFDKKLTLTEKDKSEFVTEADLASEQFLIKQLGLLLPEASFFAEESGKSQASREPFDKLRTKGKSGVYPEQSEGPGTAGSGAYCWIIDPLDGTTNFAHHIPYFCISVALTYQDKPIIGAIYQPLLGEFFYAERGRGSFLNGVKIGVNREHELAKSMVAVGFPYAKNKQFMELLEGVQRILPQGYSFRYFGAAALDLAYVAAGRLDGAFFEGLGWWDVAAGIVLIEEAGGRVSDFQGQEVTPSYVSFLAANREMHEILLPLLTLRQAPSLR